jgi:hypothetical protein
MSSPKNEYADEKLPTAYPEALDSDTDAPSFTALIEEGSSRL